MQVQEEMVRRARLDTGTGKRRVYSGKYALSHLVYCAHCGDIYRRTHWRIRGEKQIVWRCVSRIEKKKSGIDCPSRTIYEKNLHAAVVTALNQVIEKKDELLPGMKIALEMTLGHDNNARVMEIDQQLETMQKELLRRANANQEIEALAEKIDALRKEKQALLLEDSSRAGQRKDIDGLEAFLDDQSTKVEDYDEVMVRKLIRKITVFDDRLVFEFKSGIETEVQM